MAKIIGGVQSTVPLVALALALVLPMTAWGLATETIGNEEMSEFNYTAWKGIMPLVNDKCRVYGLWINGNEFFYYKGTAKEINTALKNFAKIEVKTLVVALRPGAGMTNTLQREKITFDWELHVVGGLAARFTKESMEELELPQHPVLTLHVTEEFDLGSLVIPKGVTLVTAPARGNEQEKYTELKKKLNEFVASRKNK